MRRIGTPLRALVMAALLLLAWQLLVWLSGAPAYILPAPAAVFESLVDARALLWEHAVVTLTEIVLGMLVGVLCGVVFALLLASSVFLRGWLLPLLVISQAIPAFTLAPILVLWLGYGMFSKIAMASLLIFFPVTAALYDGLRRTNVGWLQLAHTMGARKSQILWQISLPAALPALASGLRIGAAVAPIGAIVGEWVGASEGLGYLMMHANARMQIELTFAALLVLCVFSVGFYVFFDKILSKLIYWQP